ncbi:MAG: B12-binding domain-containing radical SAM protein [Desulfosudaceae bacterium]
MRVLLINPFYPVSETPSPPLGLAYLAAALENAGMEVRVLDFVVYPYSKTALAAELKAFAPHLAGVTAVTMTFDHASRIIRDIKAIDSGIRTVMGGPHVSMCAETTLAEIRELDLVVIGEADDTIIELTRAADQGRPWEEIPGLVYRQEGDIRATPVKPYQVDVRKLPFPARHLLPLGRYRALNMPVSITTSRGCPFKCIFCVGRKMVGARVRYRDPVAVVDELEYLRSLNFKQINIADDLFTASKKHCHGVCDEIIRRRLPITWSSFARVDTVNYDLLRKMKEAGCTAVSFGVETANRDILKTIRKGITIEQVVDAIQACTRAEILPHASFILGLPGETPETVAETRNFGETIKAMGASYGFHLLAPFPGTEIRQRAREMGIHILSDSWSDYHANRAIVATDTVGTDLFNQIAIEWEQKLDIWLGEIKEKMEAGQASAEEAWPLVSLENTVIHYDLMMKSSLERRGFWRVSQPDAPTGQLLEELARRVYQDTDYQLERVRDALDWARENGCLVCDIDADRVSWHWQDHL